MTGRPAKRWKPFHRLVRFNGDGYGRPIAKEEGRESAIDAAWWAEARGVCLRVARHYSGDPVEAEDVAQDAVIRAWRRLTTLRIDQRRREWLASIARNEAFRHRSRRRPEPVATVASAGGVDDERVLTAAERTDVNAALARLATPDRLLLRLRYAEDLTQAAIAALLQLPEGTVKVRLHRARARFRDAYGAP